ncbi:MAG TPA: hypothetical protein VE953_13925 [Terriglobales bacterium]|nr:hypothetical protein [Terriglobales bacterium]
MNATLTILSPVPEGLARTAAAPVAWDLPGRLRVGLLSNSKPNTTHLLDGVGQVLAADPRIEITVRAAKPSASRPAGQAMLDELAAGADLVVGATAD